MTKKRKIVMGLSGGMDSATLLGHLLEEGAEVHCCSFYYGSKHNEYEKRAVSQIAEYYYQKGLPVVIHFINLEEAFKGFSSNLLQTGGEIPEGHYNDDNMKLTVIPGRNLIFLSIMAGLAESIGADTIALGVHAGDHHIYPDCRPEFIMSAGITIYLSSDRKVEVVAPFSNDNKASILQRGLSYKVQVPYHLTRTCYKDQEKSCGKCGSCQERLEAFYNIGMTDPILYQE